MPLDTEHEGALCLAAGERVKRTTMYLHLIFLFLIAAGAAYLMVLAGMSKSALDLKRTSRMCPSCGRATRDCSCQR